MIILKQIFSRLDSESSNCFICISSPSISFNMAQRDASSSACLASQPYAGRLGGNQEFILDPMKLENQHALKRLPDASPFISIPDIFNLRGFLEPELWKAAAIEFIGTLLLVWSTGFVAAHSSTAPPPQLSPTSGVYSTPIFLGPVMGGICNTILLTLFIYSLGSASGAHLNPMITISTFTARLSSFSRTVLYVAFQTAGGAVAGMLLRVSFGSRDFVAGGCQVDTSLVPTGDIFALEFMSDFMLIFLCFGVGLDPRQRENFGPALGPFLVGLSLGVISFLTGFARAGYAGASMNPARCTGIFVGSGFPTWAWIVWIAPISACIVHGVVYWAFPPWTRPKADSPDATLTPKKEGVQGFRVQGFSNL
ncbi:aquaporin-like protein [Lipomyces kononenkoae]|uniref:Aquaporin-like protein n=1 Tax=Lipomyces kononenkoae TaxID=34357 RepID=A0ACC3SS23_LIPKO